MKKRKILITIIVITILLCTSIYTNKVYSAENQITYKAHVENIGWQDWRNEGAEAGTTGRALRMEAVIINNNNSNFKITYKAHVENIGWQDWRNEGEEAGTTGRALRLEAVQIKLENLSSESSYDIEYRAHVENIGWQGWKKNGEVAGTTGRALRAEAIQIRILKDDTVVETVNVTTGIDVSTFQGNIDWSKVKSDNIEFAMIRAGYRGYGTGKLATDSDYKTNITGALKNNIKVGVYFFTQAITEKEAIEEANYVLQLVKDYNITYPIAIDVEDIPNADGRADNLSREQRTKIVKAFCKKIKEAGYKPMIYANEWWLYTHLNMSELSEYDVWLAHYTGATRSNPFKKPSDYTGRYSMWQYTSSGSVKGIQGFVDLDTIIE